MLELQTFGTVGLRTREELESQAQLVQPKRLALLIYLALAPRRRLRRRDQIVGLFWPELDQEHARGALSQALKYLRRHLGDDAIVTQGEEEAGLNRERIWCDAVAFGSLCDAPDPEKALELYKGTFLDGFLLADGGQAYEEWVATERAALRQRAAQAAGALAERAEQLPDLGAAVRWAARAAEIAPGDEVIAARLIRLQDQSGDRAGALRTYEALRERLKQEFQVAPSRETQALVSRILDR